jgi:hypothetical protein
MWSRTFALFVRAIRLDARLLRSHLARVALLAFVVSMLFYGNLSGIMFGAPGLRFFQALVWINYGFATLAATLLFSTAITEEKEEQTLGLLRMANVGAGPLLIGKGGPRLLAALLILSVQFPFTLLAITLGGVSWEQVTAAYWTLFAHILFVGSVGLLSSVVFRRSAGAAGCTGIVILLTLIVPPLLRELCWTITLATGMEPWQMRLAEWGLPWSEELYRATTFARLREVLSTGFDESPFGLQVAANGGAAVLLFGLAWLLFEPFNRSLDVAAPAAVSVLNRVIRIQSRSRRAWPAAVIWKDFYHMSGGHNAWIAKVLAYGPLLLLIMYYAEDFRSSSVTAEEYGGALMSIALFLILPLESLVLAARIFRSELKEKTWSTLYALPRSLPGVAYPKVAGCLLGLAPVTAYFVLGAVLDTQDVDRITRDVLREPYRIAMIVCFVSHFLLLLHLTSLFTIISNGWVGVLLAIVVSCIGIWIQIVLIEVPIMMLSMRGMVGPPGRFELYLGFAFSLSAAVLLLLTALVHYLIGMRLKTAAAAS